jgi:hypothetical protein
MSNGIASGHTPKLKSSKVKSNGIASGHTPKISPNYIVSVINKYHGGYTYISPHHKLQGAQCLTKDQGGEGLGAGSFNSLK